jgi:DNA-binding NarL/FixJ family response regulator
MNQTDSFDSDQEVINGKRWTRRQGEILVALCSGRPYKQMARMMGITEGTLKVYMSRLMGATGKNRTELALIGYQLSKRRAEAALPEHPPQSPVPATA